MCGRVTQKTGALPGFVTVTGVGDSRIKDPKDWVRFNGAPSQEFWIIRQHPETRENHKDRMTWGLVPYWGEGWHRRPQTHQRQVRDGRIAAHVP